MTYKQKVFNQLLKTAVKKLLIIVVLAVTVTAGALAIPEKVNSVILSNFQSECKEASKVTWQISHNSTKAEFTASNTKMQAYYNFNGDIIANGKSIDLDELPANTKRSFATKFAGCHVTAAISFKGSDKTAYCILGENENEKVILKADESNQVSVYATTKR